MKRLTAELIPDAELGGFMARVPDNPASRRGVALHRNNGRRLNNFLGSFPAAGRPGAAARNADARPVLSRPRAAGRGSRPPSPHR